MFYCKNYTFNMILIPIHKNSGDFLSGIRNYPHIFQARVSGPDSGIRNSGAQVHIDGNVFGETAITDFRGPRYFLSRTKKRSPGRLLLFYIPVGIRVTTETAVLFSSGY